jgi:hypothetical protein
VVTFGIGSGAENLFTNWASCGWAQVARGAVQAVAHGTFQGGMMAVSGGKFWNGFAAGAASSAVGSLWTADLNGARGGLGFFENYRTSSIGMIAFGTVSGGGSSSSSPQITYQPANAYSFASGGGTSAMVTSRSTSPGGGYNSSVEMHPYVNEVPSMYNNYQGQNYNTTGAVTTGLGTAFTAAEIKMFNQTSWYSIKQFKTYGQNFNGNGATGGKLALAKRVSTGFKIGGYGLGVFNGVSTFSDYLNGNISTQSFITEQASNAYSTFGGAYGAAWGVGWEGGRWITHREFYRNWKRETWLPWRKENWGY